MTQSEFIVKMYEVLLLAIKNVQKMFFASEAHRLGFVDDDAYRKFIMDGWQSTERPSEKDLTQKAERGDPTCRKIKRRKAWKIATQQNRPLDRLQGAEGRTEARL